MRLTALYGSPILCVLKIQVVQKDLAIETGNDISVNTDGNPEEGDIFLFKNIGTEKTFPSLLSVQTLYLHCLARWNESSIRTSQIPIEILATLDILNVIPKDDMNTKSSLLIDVHKKQLHRPMFEFINAPTDHLVVSLRISYDMVICQVLDSKEQSGYFNTAL